MHLTLASIKPDELLEKYHLYGIFQTADKKDSLHKSCLFVKTFLYTGLLL